MTLKKSAVGPVDVTSWLADVRSGKVKKRENARVELLLNPAVVVEYDALADRFNSLVEKSRVESETEQSIAGESVGDYESEMDDLDAQMDALRSVASLKGTFVFRGYEAGDTAKIQDAVAAVPADARTTELGVMIEVAQYCVDPVMTVDDVRAIIPVIGYTQWSMMQAAFREHVYGVPSAPKLLRPSRTRATAKP